MKRIAAIFLALSTFLGISGCGQVKYRVDYCGQKDCYENARDTYRAGETVRLYYGIIATDTDYSFSLDDQPISFTYEEGKGFVIEFVMPEHDVKLECRWHNSMEYQP